MGLVLLSGLDSNKYRTILTFKKHITEHPNIQPTESISKSTDERNREIDGFGEIAAKKIQRQQKRLTPEETQMLIAEYQSGKEPAELGKQFGIHRITASKILKRNNIPLRNTCLRSSEI